MPSPSKSHNSPPIPAEDALRWLEARRKKRRRMEDHVVGLARYVRLLVILLAVSLFASGVWSIFRGWQAVRHAHPAPAARISK